MANAYRVAVVVRSHRSTRKFDHLLADLEGSDRYRLFAATNETRGTVACRARRKLGHDVSLLAPLGRQFESEFWLVRCSDMLFGFILDEIPGFDFYLMIEDDVHFPKGARDFVERLVDRLVAEEVPVDLTGVHLRHAEPNWYWRPDAERLFEDVRGMFFPVVGMSADAIAHCRQARLTEGERGSDPDHRVYCEAFVPSTLAAAGDRFRMVDLLELMPDCYRLPQFTVGLPFLLEDPGWVDPAVEMCHPVFSAPEYLQSHYAASVASGEPARFLAELERCEAHVPAELDAAYLRRATALAIRSQAARQAELDRRLGAVEERLAGLEADGGT